MAPPQNAPEAQLNKECIEIDYAAAKQKQTHGPTDRPKSNRCLLIHSAVAGCEATG